jgi:hypothetical protein
MPDNLLGRIGNFLHGRPWYKLPRVLAFPQLVEIRNQLRKENLIDTEEPPLEKKAIPANLNPAVRDERTVDGTYNDLQYPMMGSCGRRFGRNVPLEHTFPDQPTRSPRALGSSAAELMTREQFQPATIQSCRRVIQFMVHDWSSTSAQPRGDLDPPAPGDDRRTAR